MQMKLQEWINENKDKEVVFEDGRLTIKEPETQGRWKPEDGDDYFALLGNGEVIKFHRTDHYRNHPDHFAIGNVFKTEEDAKFAVERLKIRAELLDLGGRDEFKPNQMNFYICGDISQNTIYSAIAGKNPCLNAVYFDDQEQGNKAIQAVGVDRLKKMLFGENHAQ